MLYDIINYSNEVIGRVEADDAVEAWSKAGNEFGNILDVGQVMALPEHHEERAKWLLRKELGHHSSPEIKTYYHESPFADIILKEGFSMEVERRSDPGDFGWGVYLWSTPHHMPKGYTLEVDVDISRFAVIHDPYTPVNPYEIRHDTPDEALFRELAFGTNQWGNEVMATIHPIIKNGEEWSRERTCKNIRDTFLKRGVQGFITYHDHRSIEEIVLFDLSTIKDIRQL